MRKFERTFATNYKAFYWQSPTGLITDFFAYASTWMFEDRTDQNPPRAARAYALLGPVLFDALIASNDGKFAYWYLRPHRLDPQITPLFPVPAFPSYPSKHSTLSTAFVYSNGDRPGTEYLPPEEALEMAMAIARMSKEG